MDYTIAEFKRIARTLVKATDSGRPIPIMLESVHGMGKSEVIRQLAGEWGMGFYDCRTSELSEGDILGFPRAGSDYMDYLPPKFVLDAAKHPYVLLFDEFNRGTPEVYNALMRAGDSHMIGNIKLHPDTRIFAAINPSGEGNHVRKLDRPQKDRWWRGTLAPSVEEWIGWAREKGINPMVVEYIDENRDDLDPPPYKLSASYVGSSRAQLGGDDIEPSRRSWVRLSRVLDGREGLEDLLFIAAGFIGYEKALSFEQFCLSEAGRSPWRRFIVEGDTRTPSLEESIRIVQAIEKGSLTEKNIDEYLDNLISFILGLKPEILSRVFVALRQESTPVEVSVKIMKKQIHKGNQSVQTVGGYIMDALKL